MKVKDYFEDAAKRGTWASLYDEELDRHNYNFLTRRAQVIRLLSTDQTFNQVLDLGCGTGDYAQVADAHGGAYHGIDFSPEMALQARIRSDNPAQTSITVASGEHIPYGDNSFDLVLAIGYIEYFRDPTTALLEIRRVLKTGGVLVMQSPKRQIAGTLGPLVGAPVRFVYRQFIHRGTGKLRSRPDVMVRYSGHRLDDLLKKFGFARTDYAFNNFYFYPERFRMLFPGLSIWLSEAVTRFNPKTLGVLALNYVGKYKLEKAGPVDKP